MPWTVSARNNALDNIAASGSWISLHTTDPGPSGTSECTGGSYTRVQTTWGASSLGVKSGTAVTMIPSGTATFWGVWSAATGGTFLGSFPLAQGQFASFLFTPTTTD